MKDFSDEDKPTSRKSFTTIADIAKHTGFSKSTVARALSHSDGVRKSTRDKILNSAKELGYETNVMLSSWMSRVRGKGSSASSLFEIAWIDGCDQHPSKTIFLNRIFKSASDTAYRLGYHFVRYNIGKKDMSPQRIRQILTTRNVAGIIYFLPIMAYSKNLLMNEFPGVCLGGWTEAFEMPLITTAHGENIELAFQKMKTLNYNKIGFAISKEISHARLHTDCAKYLWCCELSQQEPAYFLYEDFPKAQLIKWINDTEIDAILVCDSRFGDLLQNHKSKTNPPTGLAHLNINEDVKDWAGIIEPHEKMGKLAMSVLNAQILSGEDVNDQFSEQIRIPGIWQEGVTAPYKG